MESFLQLKLFDFLDSEVNDFEFILFDRIEKIKSIIEQYGEKNFYISFSGGKDSTILHFLIDMALPNNKIPRVFSNTGLEFREVYKFVKELSKNDKRIVIISPRKNVIKTLERVGYPFKSKEHSLKVSQYKNGSRAKNVLNYMSPKNKTKFCCPKSLLYQYKDEFQLKISDRCCYEFKKNTLINYSSSINRKIAITGMRKEEGGQRVKMQCTIFSDGELTKFHPLATVTEQWEEWFIKKFNTQLCKLYYPPYNFERTGCVGCPFNLNIRKELKILKKLLPGEYKRAYLYFGKVYNEYKRIDYRI